MKPVRTRSRFGACAVVALAGLVGPVHRAGARAVPARLAGVAGRLGDRGGDALGRRVRGVAGGRAGSAPRRRAAGAQPRLARRRGGDGAALALFALFATVDVPGLSMQPAERGWTLLDSCLHCIGTIAKVAVVFLIVGLVALRRLVPGRAARASGWRWAPPPARWAACCWCSSARSRAPRTSCWGTSGGMVLAAIAGAMLHAPRPRAPRSPRRCSLCSRSAAADGDVGRYLARAASRSERVLDGHGARR